MHDDRQSPAHGYPITIQLRLVEAPDLAPVLAQILFGSPIIFFGCLAASGNDSPAGVLLLVCLFSIRTLAAKLRWPSCGFYFRFALDQDWQEIKKG